jgi:hypothetical protein
MSGYAVVWNEIPVGAWSLAAGSNRRRTRTATLMAVLRVGMGAGVGAVFGAVSCNMAFWLAVGIMLGAVFANGLGRTGRTQVSAGVLSASDTEWPSR